MSDAAPAVSVVMAAYNGAALIEATLASLERQTLRGFEVLVVDDCSTDHTRDVVRGWRDPRVRLIALGCNGGPVRARNHGVAQARGRFIAALDQDDLCHPDRFARQVAFLNAHPDVALVATAAQVLEGDRLRKPVHHPRVTCPATLAWLIRIGNPLVWSSVMVRADVARALDPFTRPERLYAEDFDLYHRVAAMGRIARIDVPLVIYRSHIGGASQRFTERMEASAAAVLEEANAAALGEDTHNAVQLIVRHLMGARPVPDAATLAALHDVLVRMQAHHLATHAVTQGEARLIARATARRWARVLRDAKRTGAVGWREALTLRPRVAHGGLAWRAAPAADTATHRLHA